MVIPQNRKRLTGSVAHVTATPLCYEFCVECSSKAVHNTVRARTTENISELIEVTHSFCSHKILLSFVETTID